MDDLLREFLTETNESMAQLDVQLIELEQNPNNPELLGSIFRLVHTVKGTCGFLGLPRLEKVAHAGENVLGKFRDGVLEVTPAAVSLILRALDRIKSLLSQLEAAEKEPEGEDSELIAELNLWADGKGGTAAAAPAPAAAAAPTPAAQPSVPVPDEFGFVPVRAEDTGKPAEAVAAAPPPPKEEPKPAAVAPAPAAATLAKQDDHAAKESSVSASSIRVSVDVLENLMTMVSELVLTRNQLLQISRKSKDTDFTPPLQRLNHVVSELQEGVMKTRMQPIGNAWSKLPRIVRDLALELGKKIDLQMLGAETELDRQVLELIKDPLTHMVRNSADHGIEMPADRAKAGKPETGRIILNAYHEGGHIIIEIADDGKGLALDKIKAKAIQNGVATEAEVAAMSDQQIMQFIFKAGFSTAAKVTSVSGRGVGMDVVRTNIEKIGGTIDMTSALGKGSRFLIKIPLTLAIVSALIVECSGERFAIPQLSVIELVRASARTDNKIEHINNTPVLRLRNRLLPLVSLRKLLKLDGSKDLKEEDSFIVVAQVGNNTFGIMVDRVYDTEEIVVKPVTALLRDIAMFSGNTILGDGSVIMILDPNGISAQAGEISNAGAEEKAQKATVGVKQGSKQALLLFSAGGSSVPKAVPLALVARLEEVDTRTIEVSNGKPLVQYRGKLMPLIPIGGEATFTLERQPILVFSDTERSMGLIVDQIIDIVEDNLNVELSADKPGMMGSAIISGKATEVIDIGYFIDQAFADWFGVKDEETYGENRKDRILLVDDSPFFRNLLLPLLTVNGYQVTTAEDPVQALKYQEEGRKFDAIVSDIEMPNMNGFDFVTTIRNKDCLWRQLPVIAMSSHTTPRDLERGREVGFTDYVAKYDREGLLQALMTSLTTPKGQA